VLPNAIHILQDIVIPKTQDPVTARLEPHRPPAVAYQRAQSRMLSAIEFDYEFCARTKEVDHEGTNGLLAAKLNAVELVPAKDIP
jgi:hypothetical protein